MLWQIKEIFLPEMLSKIKQIIYSTRDNFTQ
ncbi:MAG: hypothetical protein LBK18_09040 [Prevotellaceae bacterium]|nr:hypothetical protein [Prevotellaceae bacterium]